MALAQTQTGQGDYQASIATYGGILKDDPEYQPALDGEVSAAEAWVENFEVSAPEGQDAVPVAAGMLDQIMPILEAGLARTQGAPAAEIEAHLAWAQLWNENMADRDSGSAVDDDLRKALALDPQNALANAMMGDATLRKDGNLDDALRFFRTAEAAGKDRPSVRLFEVSSLLVDEDRKGARAELVRVANAMRKDGEPMTDEAKNRVVTFCFDPAMNSHEEVMESMTAVTPGEAWATYQWLEANADANADNKQLLDRFVEASLLEVGGNRAGALAKFLALQKEMVDRAGPLKDQVNAEVRQLQG
jgi:tetratricopeptide (TPR) repeat protein